MSPIEIEIRRTKIIFLLLLLIVAMVAYLYGLRENGVIIEQKINQTELFTESNYNPDIKLGEGLEYAKGTGNSMLPTFKTNQTLILSRKFNISDIRPGDIIVYNESNIYVDHRLIWRNETHFISKGDNNNISDDIKPLNKIIAIVVGAIY